MGELWFDARYLDSETGAVYNEADAAPQLEAGDSTLCSIGGILLDNAFERPKGGFRGEMYAERRKRIKSFTPDELQAFGSWVLELVQAESGDEERLLTQRDIRRLSVMALGPSEVRLLNGAGVKNMWEYRNLIGLPAGKTHRRFEHWGPVEYAAYARKVEKLAQGRPGREDYDKAAALGWGPSNAGIYKVYGGISKLNELLWYPDVEAMTPSDMVYWGVRAKRANQGIYLSTTVIEILSGRHRGPSQQVILKNFGKWRNFTEQVDDIYDAEQQEAELERKEKLAMYDQMIQSGELPETVASMGESQLFAFAGKYRVVNALMPTMDRDRLLRISGLTPGAFVDELIGSRGKLSKALIEVTAVKLCVFDDIWPLDDGLRHLVITEEELGKKRARDAEVVRTRNARRRASR